MSQLTNRRGFFKTAAAGAIGAAASVETVMAASPKVSADRDLIILGAGCGGLCCAVRAAELGLKVTLLEKMSTSAGNTIYAAGFLLGVHTSFQAGKNDADSVDAFYEDMMKVSQGKGDPKLTRKVAEDADKTLEWMHKSAGINFAAGSKLVWPMLSRAHLVTGKVKPGGAQLSLSLIERAKALGVDLRFNTKAVAILQDEKTGAVNGVRIKTKEGLSELRSKKGVVIATGGFSANQAMVTQYIGSGGAKMPIRGSRIIAGENIALTAPFLPKVVNVDQYHCGPIHGPTGANPLNIVNNGVCINRKGERFTDEGQTYVQMSRDVASMTPDNWAFMVADQTCRENPVLANDWDSYARLGAPVYVGNTIEETAKKAGLDPAKVASTVAEYNKAVKEEKRGELVPVNTLPKAPLVEKAPFYIVPFQGGMTATFGGPLINTNGQVLDTENRPIDGLFAVGNAVGGLFYDNYVGGAQLTSAAVFGVAVAEFVKG